MAREKPWTKEVLESEAKDIAARGEVGDVYAYVDDYCAMWREEGKRLPFDPDDLVDAICAAMRARGTK